MARLLRIGDLTSAQTRYYNVLYPGLVALACLALAQMPDRVARPLAAALIAALLVAGTHRYFWTFGA